MEKLEETIKSLIKRLNTQEKLMEHVNKLIDDKYVDSRQWAECCECQKLTKEKRYVYIKDIVLKCYIPFCKDCNNEYK